MVVMQECTERMLSLQKELTSSLNLWIHMLQTLAAISNLIEEKPIANDADIESLYSMFQTLGWLLEVRHQCFSN